jgi:hypothetical protein
MELNVTAELAKDAEHDKYQLILVSKILGACYHEQDMFHELLVAWCDFPVGEVTWEPLSVMAVVFEKVGPTQRTLTKVNHRVAQRTKLIHDLPQTRYVLRCRVKSSCSGPGDLYACPVLSTSFTFKSAKPVDVTLDSSLGRL